MSNITLISPPHLQLQLNYSSISHPPLGLAYIAAYVREKGHNVRIIDAVSQAVDKRSTWEPNKDITVVGLGIEEIVNRIPATSDIIGVTCVSTPAWPYLRELVKAIKERFPKIPLVAGGEHVTGMWETVLLSSPVDFCVLGEGEITFEELINEITNGEGLAKIKGIAYKSANKPVLNEPRPRIKNIDSIPSPAWDLIDIERYIEKKLFMGASKGRTMPITASRGCPYQCRFCTAQNMWKHLWVPRDAKKVVDEIESYIHKYGADDFHLMDLTAIVRKDWIVNFAKEILKRKLRISWQLPVGTRTAAIDKEVTDLLVKSGCGNITFAPESGSKKILDKMGKNINLQQLETSVKTALSSKMTTCLFFLMGFPGETIQDIKMTFRLMKRMAFIGVHEIAISTFIPIPGTAIFNELKTKHPEQFELTDEFCYTLFYSLSLNKTNSWNPCFSNKQLLYLKIRGLIMFYTISYALRPLRLIKLLMNLFGGKQETKVDRILHEMSYKHR